MHSTTEETPLRWQDVDLDQLFKDYVSRWKRVTFGILMFSVFYHVVEAFVSIYYGLNADAISLAAFGVDSGIEIFSNFIVLYHMAVYELFKKNKNNNNNNTSNNNTNNNNGKNSGHLLSLEQERVGTICIGILLVLFGLGAVGTGGLRLYTKQVPDSEFYSLIISSTVLLIMLIMFYFKTKAAVILNSSVLTSDANCSLSCIKVTISLLIGSLLYIIKPSLWWVDSATVIVIGLLVGHEGYETVTGAWDKDNFGGGCGCCDGSDSFLAKRLRKRLNKGFMGYYNNNNNNNNDDKNNDNNNNNYYNTGNSSNENNNNNGECQDACCKDKKKEKKDKKEKKKENENNNKNNNKNTNKIAVSKNTLINIETGEGDGSCKDGCCQGKNIKNSKNNKNSKNSKNSKNNNRTQTQTQRNKVVSYNSFSQNTINLSSSSSTGYGTGNRRNRRNMNMNINNINNNNNNNNNNNQNGNDNGLFNIIDDEDEWNDILKKESKPVFVFFTAELCSVYNICIYNSFMCFVCCIAFCFEICCGACVVCGVSV